MPYNPAAAARGIAVREIVVKLEVSPSPPWSARQELTLKATVTVDGAAYPNQTVDFYVTEVGVMVASGVTGSDGVVTRTWKMPFNILPGRPMPCNSWTIQAVHRDSGVKSNTVTGAVAYLTRISIEAPSPVGVNEPFSISGVLEYESAPDVWSPLPGKTVSLYYDMRKIADVTTASDGSYSKPDVRIPEPGTYTLRAVFAGEGLTLSPTITLHGLSVGFPPELAPLAQYAPYALAAFPLILVGGAIAYSQLAPGS